MGWNPFAWLFGEDEEDGAPPEPLVLGAELRCQHGTRKSYLIVYSRDIDVNGLPGACVTDCIAQENIMPFGTCRFGGPCEKYMDLDERWENLKTQKTFINGKEIITTESTLTCRRMGGEIKADQSGQDGVMAKELLLLIEIEENYPGLLDILRDPNGNLYLNEGMCEKAIQFLEGCIRKHNGELPASDVYEPTSLETYLMMITMDKLIPGYDAANQATFTSAMEGIASSPGMDKVPEWDTHILNQEMIEALKVYCANRSEEVDTSFVFKLSEKYNYPRRELGRRIENFGYSLMLQFYSFNNMNNALITGNNGANTYSIMAGNTLRTDLATLDSATLLAIQRRELLLNNAAGLIVTSNAAAMSGNMAQFALQNNLATLNNMAESALKGGSGSKFQEVFELVDNYTLSDDTFNNHILDRHGPDSTYGNKSHFNADFDIREGIDSTMRGDNFVVGPNTAGREGYIFEQTFSNPIGTSSNGKPLYTLKVVIDEAGNVITAFPKK